jgi:hypothetical protein
VTAISLALWATLFGGADDVQVLLWKDLRTLQKHMTQVEVTVKLEREVYLPGERFCAVISVRNPTNAAMQISDPAYRRSGVFHWQRAGEDTSIAIMNHEVIYTGGGTGDYRRLIPLQAGQTIHYDTCSPSFFGRGDVSFRSFAAPPRPGEFEAVFYYEGRWVKVPFSVDAIEEFTALARVKRELYMEDPPRLKSGVPEECRGLAVAAIRTYRGTTLVEQHDSNVCRTRVPGSDDPVLPGHFTRIAEVEERITDLKIDVGRGADYIVKWTVGGEEKQLMVRPPANVLPLHVREKLGIER